MLPPYRIAVIGAGVAGSVCTSRLALPPGVHITIYDMGSRGPGGRASDRPVDGSGGNFSPADCGGASSMRAGTMPSSLTFDHGVQGFTVESPEVQELLGAWHCGGHVQRWTGRFGLLEDGAFTERIAADADAFSLLSGRPVFVGVPSMSGLVRGVLSQAVRDAMAAGASVTQLPAGSKATRVSHAVEGESESGARWTVASSDGETRLYDAVVVAGHAASFVADIADSLPSAQEHAATVEAMRHVSYPAGASPLYALMVAFDEPLGARAPFDGAALAGASSELRWISRDSSKPGRPTEGPERWVALSTEAFALRVAGVAAEWAAGAGAPSAQGGARPSEPTLQYVASELLQAMARALGASSASELPPPVYVHAQRWQAGITRAPLNLQPPCVSTWADDGLFACGDWAAAAASVEEAARSGLAAATAAARARDAALAMRARFSTRPPPAADDLATRARTEWPGAG